MCACCEWRGPEGDIWEAGKILILDLVMNCLCVYVCVFIL